MMTTTREAIVARALNDGAPDNITWQERSDPKWRTAFPCGIQPKLTYTTTLTICTEQIVQAGAHLSDSDFEEFVDALIEWVFVSGVPYRFEESTEHIMAVLQDIEPECATLLRRVADLNHCSLVQFLGADRIEFKEDTDHA